MSRDPRDVYAEWGEPMDRLRGLTHLLGVYQMEAEIYLDTLAAHRNLLVSLLAECRPLRANDAQEDS